jgi:hypothetical protein
MAVLWTVRSLAVFTLPAWTTLTSSLGIRTGSVARAGLLASDIGTVITDKAILADTLSSLAVACTVGTASAIVRTTH